MMKIKWLIILLVVICIIGLIIICFMHKTNSNKELDFVYKKNAGIPFKWEYEIEDSKIVTCTKSYVVKDENKGAIVGAPIHTKYVFKGLKKGKTKITFKYVNFTTNESFEKEVHYVKVDDQLNITLVETKS